MTQLTSWDIYGATICCTSDGLSSSGSLGGKVQTFFSRINQKHDRFCNILGLLL